MSVSTLIIGVAGGTGAGKTTFCNWISHIISSSVSIISHDMYYKDLSHMSPAKRDKRNFDHPTAFDNELFRSHLSLIKQGNGIEIPEYDFVTHTRTGRMKLLKPEKVIVAEGIMLFSDSRIRELFDYKIFIEVDSDVRFIRRLQRDMYERGRNIGAVIEQYLSTVKPMHDRYVEPSKKYADLVVSGNHLDGAVEMIVGMIFRQD